MQSLPRPELVEGRPRAPSVLRQAQHGVAGLDRRKPFRPWPGSAFSLDSMSCSEKPIMRFITGGKRGRFYFFEGGDERKKALLRHAPRRAEASVSEHLLDATINPLQDIIIRRVRYSSKLENHMETWHG